MKYASAALERKMPTGFITARVRNSTLKPRSNRGTDVTSAQPDGTYSHSSHSSD